MNKRNTFIVSLQAINQNLKRENMNIHADKTQENESQSVANEAAQKQSSGESTFQFVGNRPGKRLLNGNFRRWLIIVQEYPN